MIDVGDEDLERIGAALARGWIAAHEAREERLDVELTPAGQAEEDVLELVVPWAKQAAHLPRQPGSPQALLVEAVARMVVIKARHQDDEG